MLYRCVSRADMYVRMWGRVACNHIWRKKSERVVGGSASVMDVC